MTTHPLPHQLGNRDMVLTLRFEETRKRLLNFHSLVFLLLHFEEPSNGEVQEEQPSQGLTHGTHCLSQSGISFSRHRAMTRCGRRAPAIPVSVNMPCPELHAQWSSRCISSRVCHMAHSGRSTREVFSPIRCDRVKYRTINWVHWCCNMQWWLYIVNASTGCTCMQNSETSRSLPDMFPHQHRFTIPMDRWGREVHWQQVTHWERLSDRPLPLVAAALCGCDGRQGRNHLLGQWCFIGLQPLQGSPLQPQMLHHSLLQYGPVCRGFYQPGLSDQQCCTQPFEIPC